MGNMDRAGEEMRKIALLFVVAAVPLIARAELVCHQECEEVCVDASGGSGSGGSGGFAGESGAVVIGADGVDAFDALSTSDREALAEVKVYFQHKSIGGNILGQDPPNVGVKELGFPFAYTTSAAPYSTGRIRGELLFDAASGNPLGKAAEFRARLLGGISAVVDVAAMKFCFNDLREYHTTAQIDSIRDSYVSMVCDVKSAAPGMAWVHITPPLARGDAWNAAQVNPLRVAFGAWLIDAFPDDVVFDLQDVESTDSLGLPCETSGIREACPDWTSDSAGHLNAAGSTRAAKAFLFSLLEATR